MSMRRAVNRSVLGRWRWSSWLLCKTGWHHWAFSCINAEGERVFRCRRCSTTAIGRR